MKITTFKNYIILLLGILYASFTNAQIVLSADGPGNTYELINSVLAPGRNVVESPDASHPDFGRHITEVFDEELNKYVFEFFIHVTPDNDVSTLKTDRQRMEIKTYASSPENLIGVVGETIEYKWKFKIPFGYQPSTSFTHIHQIKAVGGDESNPIFSLTLRKDTPNKLELIYVKDYLSGSDKKVRVDLSLFEGVWVEVTEKIKVATNGTYDIVIKRVSDNSILLSYSNDNIATIRLGEVNNSFIRPKWGIYRSLNQVSSLRDESILFADFSIEELQNLSTKDEVKSKETNFFLTNPVEDNIQLSQSFIKKYDMLKIFDLNGKLIFTKKIIDVNIDVSQLPSGVYIAQFNNKKQLTEQIKFIKK